MDRWAYTTGKSFQPSYPALIPWLALLLMSWWWHSFADLDPALSRRLQREPHRYSRRARLLNLSDRMEVAAGRMSPSSFPWRDGDARQRALIRRPAPDQLWLADSGRVSL